MTLTRKLVLKDDDEFDWNQSECYMEITDKEYRHTKMMMFWGGVGCGATAMFILCLALGLYVGY